MKRELGFVALGFALFVLIGAASPYLVTRLTVDDAANYIDTDSGELKFYSKAYASGKTMADLLAISDADIPAAITRDSEWDSAAKINAATTDADFLTSIPTAIPVTKLLSDTGVSVRNAADDAHEGIQASGYYFADGSLLQGSNSGGGFYTSTSLDLAPWSASKFIAPLVESGGAGTNLTLDANSAGAGKISLGVAGDGDTIELNGNLVKTLNAATGNENALNLEYTTNKLTSGDDIGIRINQTDTASPGTSYLAWFGVGGTVKAYVQNNGAINGEVIVSNTFVAKSNNNTLLFQYRDFTAADNAVEAVTGTVTNSSGQFNAVVVKPTYNQTGTAAGTDLLIQRTETAVGSGAQKLIDAQVGTTSKFSVDNAGAVTAVGGYKSSDGTAGMTGSVVFTDGDTQTNTVIIKNGLITAWTQQ